MNRAIIASLALIPFLASADTLIFKDGTQQDGTFVSGTSRRITFLGDSGRRQVYDIANVQQLIFGQPGMQSATEPPASGDRSAAIRQLRQDIQSAMNRATLSDDDQQRLQQTVSTLREMERDVRDGRMQSVDREDVRASFGDLRQVLNAGTLRPNDRARIESDLQQLRDLRRENGSGTRSRNSSQYPDRQ